MRLARVLLLLLAFASTPAPALESNEPPGGPTVSGTNLEHLDAFVRRVDPGAERVGPGWRLTLAGARVEVIADADHDRMRIVVPVAQADSLEEAMLRRLLQANFDTALDARYAIAAGVLWSTFLHPLGSLGEAQFRSGVVQCVTLARTYGTTFQSGVLTFDGGDSGKLLEEEGRQAPSDPEALRRGGAALTRRTPPLP